MDANGMVAVPRDRPGLGVDVDVEMIESLTVRAEVVRGGDALVAV
jgi:L-alanine-DL-glutamate epimerase-like enolase superfamily enzyme